MRTSQELALTIVQKLRLSGFTAYFAGGWVRDHVMGRESDDIDIATDALPKKILDLFPRTLIVGLSFGVVIVVVEGHPFEVATFRTDVGYSDGRKPDKIIYSSPREDALRRDFTINGMFFDPLENKIYDYVGGVEDIKKGLIRTIGDPYQRFLEDRLRMVRAFRFASKFGFRIDLHTQEAILANADTLFPSVAIERVFQEFSKMAKSDRFDSACIEMHRLGLLPVIFPNLQNLHLQELKQRVQTFESMPDEAPVILYLAQLFPHHTLLEMKELVSYLKAGNDSLHVVSLYSQAKEFINKLNEGEEISLLAWVKFLAKQKSKVVFESALAWNKEEKLRLIPILDKMKERLKKPIERAFKNQPLLTGERLKEEGLKPGKIMGDLIKAAEEIAILQGVDDPEIVLNLLKKNPIWPKAIVK